MGRRVRHLNPRDAGAVIALDTRFATSNALPNRAPASGISMTVFGSPTYSAGGQGGQPRLITGVDAGLYSNLFNVASSFGNKSTIVSAWKYAGSAGSTGYYPLYISNPTDNSYFGVCYEGALLVGDYGPVPAGRTSLSTSPLTGTTAIRSQVCTGSSASLRQGGVELASKTHSQVLATGTTHRVVVGGYWWNGVIIFGSSSSTNEFYASAAIPSDNLSLAKRLEHSLAYSFKIACS
jgi:hypothetical protein